MKTFLLPVLLLLGLQATATHLRGGYVQARAISTTNLTYEVSVVIYADEVRGSAASGQADQLTVCFGDGSTQPVVRLSRVFSGDRTTSTSLYRVVHTYAGPGTYTISTAQFNRNPSRNISQGGSDLPMTLATTFAAGSNQTPAFGIPVDGFIAATNQRYVLPLNATDAEGDSLTYSLARPLTSVSGEECRTLTVTPYQYPNDVAQRGTFTLENRSGILTWNAPVEQGIYSVAIMVSEYRTGLLISQTQLELSVVVVDQPGTPVVIPPYEPARESGLVTALPGSRDEDVMLTVFPNPVDDRLQVVVQSSNPTTTTIQLTDASGRTLHKLAFRRPARQHEQMISMEGMSPGVYVLQAEVNGRSLVRKVLKK